MSFADSENSISDSDTSTDEDSNSVVDVEAETSQLRKTLQFPEGELLSEDKNIDALNYSIVTSKRAQLDFIQKLHVLNLQVTWKLPMLHEVSTQTVRLPEKEIRNIISKHGLPLRRGHFTPDEDEIIAKNWKKLCQKFNIPDVPQALSSWRNVTNNYSLLKTRRNVILWLARGLNNRTPAQVFQRFSHTMGSSVKGVYSKEHLEIIQFFMQNEKKYTQQHLATMLGRNERSMYRCIRNINKKQSINPRTRTKWNLEVCEKVLKNLLFIVNNKLGETADDVKLTNENLQILRTEIITAHNWKQLSEATSLEVYTLKQHWNFKIYNQLFSPNKIYTKSILFKLIPILKERGYQHWQDISWKSVAEEFEYLKPIFLWTIYYRCILKYCVDKIKYFKETVDYLYDNFVLCNRAMGNYKLNRLKVINGKLQLY